MHCDQQRALDDDRKTTELSATRQFDEVEFYQARGSDSIQNIYSLVQKLGLIRHQNGPNRALIGPQTGPKIGPKFGSARSKNRAHPKPKTGLDLPKAQLTGPTRGALMLAVKPLKGTCGWIRGDCWSFNSKWKFKPHSNTNRRGAHCIYKDEDRRGRQQRNGVRKSKGKWDLLEAFVAIGLEETDLLLISKQSPCDIIL